MTFLEDQCLAPAPSDEKFLNSSYRFLGNGLLKPSKVYYSKLHFHFLIFSFLLHFFANRFNRIVTSLLLILLELSNTSLNISLIKTKIFWEPNWLMSCRYENKSRVTRYLCDDLSDTESLRWLWRHARSNDCYIVDCVVLAQASANPVCAGLFDGVVVERGKLAKGSLISNQFTRQLQQLMELINVRQ